MFFLNHRDVIFALIIMIFSHRDDMIKKEVKTSLILPNNSYHLISIIFYLN